MLDSSDKRSSGVPTDDSSITGNEVERPEWLLPMPDPPPSQPPVVQIVSQDNRGEAVAEGVPYYVHCLVQDEAQSDHDVELHDLLADIMPPSVRLGSERSLRIMTSSRTHLIMVAGFDDLGPDDDKGANPDKSGFWECTDSHNPCESVSPEGFLEYPRIPPEVFQHRYMSVFAMWSNPPRRWQIHSTRRT